MDFDVPALGDLAVSIFVPRKAHYFMCPECAEDVRALTVFTANAKAVFREEATGPTPHAGVLFSGRVLWLSAALNVVLLLGFGYVLLKIQPDKNREIAQAMAPQFVQDIAVLGVARLFVPTSRSRSARLVTN